MNEAAVTRRSYVQKDDLKAYLSAHEQLTVIICKSNDYYLKILSIMLCVVGNIDLPMLKAVSRNDYIHTAMKTCRQVSSENSSRTVKLFLICSTV